MRLAVLAVSLTILLTACGGDSEEQGPTTTALEDARTSCADLEVGNKYIKSSLKPAGRFIKVEDGGETLVVSGGNQFATGPAGFCVLGALDAPASTISKVEGTTAMMGRLTDEFGDYELTWSFHPESGLDMIIELVG